LKPFFFPPPSLPSASILIQESFFFSSLGLVGSRRARRTLFCQCRRLTINAPRPSPSPFSFRGLLVAYLVGRRRFRILLPVLRMRRWVLLLFSPFLIIHRLAFSSLSPKSACARIIIKPPPFFLLLFHEGGFFLPLSAKNLERSDNDASSLPHYPCLNCLRPSPLFFPFFPFPSDCPFLSFYISSQHIEEEAIEYESLSPFFSISCFESGGAFLLFVLARRSFFPFRFFQLPFVGLLRIAIEGKFPLFSLSRFPAWHDRAFFPPPDITPFFFLPLLRGCDSRNEPDSLSPYLMAK